MGLDEIKAAMDAQALKVREVKGAGADKAAVDAEVKALLKLKEDYAAAGGVVEAPKDKKKKKKDEAGPSAADTEAEAKKKAKEKEKEDKKAARKAGKAAAVASKQPEGGAAPAKAAAPSKAAAPTPSGGIVVFPGSSVAIKMAAAMAGLTVSAAAPPASTGGAPTAPGTPAVSTKEGVVAGARTVLAYCCDQSPKLAPASTLEAAQIQQWLAYSFGASAAKEIDNALLHRTFLAGNHLTAADLAVYEAVHPTVSASKCSDLVNLTRWFEYIQSLEGVSGLPAVSFGTKFFVPTIVAGAADKPKAQKGKKEEKKGAKESAAPAAKGATPAAAAPAAEMTMEEKQLAKKKAKEDAKAAKKAAGGAGEAEGKKKEKKATGDWNVGHLKIVVGTIQKAWEHPDSDKLWCEEITVGEDQPRQIASGLRKYYPQASQLEGRKVLVLANLKPKKLGGFPSNGMVMCASNSDKSETIFVEVPSSVPDGEVVTFDGFDQEKATPQQMDKKKVFEAVAPTLVVADDGTCTCNVDGKAVVFTTTAGPCMAPKMGGSHIA